MFKISLSSDAQQPHMYLFAGPSVGFLLSARWDQKIQAYYGNADTLISLTNYFKTIDISIVGGIGLTYDLKYGMQIFLSAGYAAGLTDLQKNDNAFKAGAISSRDVRILTGVMFSL